MADETAKPAAANDEAPATAREHEGVRPGDVTAKTTESAEAEKSEAASSADKAGKDQARSDKPAEKTVNKTASSRAAKKSSSDPAARTEPSLELPPEKKRAPKILSALSGTKTDAEKSDAEKMSVLAKAATMFGNLDADQRIRKAAEQNERLLWAGAAGATLIYALLIASQSMTGMLVPLDQLQRQQEMERRGQGGNIVSVEIVPEPDRNSKTTKWQDGNEMPPQQQMPPMPAVPQTEALPQPQEEVQEEAKDAPEKETEKQPEKEKEPEETKEAKHENNDQPRPEDSPMLLDLDSLVDAAAADLKRKIDQHYDRSPQRRQQQAAAASGAVKVRGSGASGKSDPFTDSVIASLMKSRPPPVALWGRVLVTFQIGVNGELMYVRVLQSSGNTAMDQAAVKAIRKARFKRPPPGLTAEQRTYIIDYIFG